MILSKFDCDHEGNIQAKNIVRILSFGIKNGVVSLWAITDPLGAIGLPVATFHVKQTDDSVTQEEVTTYVTTLHEKDGGDYFVFGERPQIASQPPVAPMAPPPGGLQI